MKAPTPLLDQKLEHEIEKIKEEIQSLRRPYYRSHQFYVSLLATITPFGAIYLAYILSDAEKLINIQLRENTLVIKQIEIDKKTLEYEKILLANKNDSLRADMNRYKTEIDSLLRDKASLSGKVVQLVAVNKRMEDIKLEATTELQKSSIVILLTNSGQGEAIIDSIIVSVDGQTFNLQKANQEKLKFKNPLNDVMFQINTAVANGLSKIASGHKKPLLMITDTKLSTNSPIELELKVMVYYRTVKNSKKSMSQLLSVKGVI